MINCCQLLIDQHAETRRLLEALATCIHADAIDLIAAQTLYEAIVLDLQQHYVLEEQGLFETVNQYRSMILMEVEHDDLLALQNTLGEALSTLKDEAGPIEPDPLKQRFLSFQERLLAHMQEEEKGIFPLIQRWLEPEEQQKVLRRFSELQAAMKHQHPQLVRPVPQFKIRPTQIFQEITRPVSYETLYEREHTLIQHLTLQAGKTLASHWAGQHQYILVLSGSILLETPQQEPHELQPGMTAQLDSRLWFSLKAIQDSHLIVFKVWPHPHFAKT